MFILSMMTPQEPLWKYRVMLVLLCLEVQFEQMENGHTTLVRLHMKMKVITLWTD
jgi:hypothetical protein